MLDDSRIAELAQRLQRAEDEKQFIRMFSLEHPDMTVEDAYAIPRAWTAIKLSKGARGERPQDRPHVARDAERGWD
jgi:2-oxo-hept-3-ene-1,7-dioate hydratase